MTDELPLWFPPMSSDDSSDSSILFFFQNLIEEAKLQDTGTSNRRRYIERQREEGHETLMTDYFVEDPKYNEDIFRYRFRMSKRLFLKIVADMEENDPWFEEAPDARGRKGFTSLQKVTSAIKQLATGNTPDDPALDDTVHNMILKDEGKAIAPVHIRDPPVEPALDNTVLGELMDEDTHWRLKHDLIDHLASQDLP
ncbi:uncharacterized protein LOC110875987 [Helianthus annuus]|uniref:uncharacterized protein LOC110875987 n=1 Tax=Helianthus annuus TaxID=4232 RepID=UPI000B8F9B86|nr:uncharacterized protein LOC110875987 [Helianthus annuus]